MATILQYDLAVTGLNNVDRALAGLERRMATHNQRVGRIFGATGAGARSGSVANRVAGRAQDPGIAAAKAARAQERAAAVAARAEIRAANQVAKAKESASKRAEQAEVRTAQRAAAARQRLEARNFAYKTALQNRHFSQEQRSSERISRQQSHAARNSAMSRGAFVRSTAGDAAGRIGGTVRAVGSMGAAAVGIGGAALAATAVSQAGKLDETSRRLSILGRDMGGQGVDPDALRKSFTQAGIASGIAPEEVATGVSAYVTETGDLKGGLASMQTFATTAQATGASIQDIAVAAAHMRKIGITSIDDMQASLAKLTMQGKKGSFELKDMAQQFPEIMAQAATFGVTGQQGLTELGGIMQIAKTATGSGSEASTAVQTMFRQLSASALDIQSGKSFAGRKAEVFEGGDTKGKLKNFRETLGEILVASEGDLPQLQQVFDVRGIKAVNPMVSAFRETRTAALASGSSRKDANERGRVAALGVLDKASNVESSYAEIQRDSADAMRSFNVQMELFNTKLKDAVASELFPELVKLAPEMAKLIPYVAAATRAFIDLIKFFQSNPWTAIGAAVSGAIVLSIAKAGIGAAVSAALARLLAGGAGAALPGAGGVAGVGGAVAGKGVKGVAMRGVAAAGAGLLALEAGSAIAGATGASGSAQATAGTVAGATTAGAAMAGPVGAAVGLAAGMLFDSISALRSQLSGSGPTGYDLGDNVGDTKNSEKARQLQDAQVAKQLSDAALKMSAAADRLSAAQPPLNRANGPSPVKS